MRRPRYFLGLASLTAAAALVLPVAGCVASPEPELDEYWDSEFDYEEDYERQYEEEYDQWLAEEYEQFAPAEQPVDGLTDGGIPWTEAVHNVWSYQRVCGPFAGWGSSDDDVFFNLGVDYPNPGRFQIVIWDIGWIDPIPSVGSTVCVSGDISLYEGVAQVELYDPGAIELYM